MARGGAIYLGNDAEIEFERTSVKTNGRILRENIAPATQRWSFDYADSILQTGDRIRVIRTDAKTNGGYKKLILIDGATDNSSEFFVYVDLLGRIYCYNKLTDALTKEGADALSLTKGTTNEWEKDQANQDWFQNVSIEVIEQGFRPFAKCNDYTLTTSKDTIDVTTLGEYFYKQYENGLIGGQGTVTAIWDEQALSNEGCPDPYVETGGDELSAYFAKLILRIQIGAGFRGRFYLRTRDDDRKPEADRWAVYWQADCVCTNVAVQAMPGEMLQTRIEFVTTGLFQLEISDRRAESSLAAQNGLLLSREGDAGLLLTD
jgi:hypothetical protein